MNPEELQKFTVKAEKIVGQLEKNNLTLKSLLDKIDEKNNTIARLEAALHYVKDTIENMEDAWWIESPNKGGFDMGIINSALNIGDDN